MSAVGPSQSASSASAPADHAGGLCLGCIADDFTGATDLANNLVRAGMRVVQAIGVYQADDDWNQNPTPLEAAPRRVWDWGDTQIMRSVRQPWRGAELWPLIMNEDWCLSSPSFFSGSHHRELWAHDRPYSYLGIQAAAGIGYGAGASGGAALAARQRNRIVINIQTDGDLNYAPGVLWSAAHHRLPMLTIMHNNRAWHQELMFLEFLAGTRGRGTDRAHIGTTLRDPFIDYRKMAEAYGMAAEGPIEDPAALRGAFERGVAAVKRGEPCLIDVITQPR